VVRPGTCLWGVGAAARSARVHPVELGRLRYAEIGGLSPLFVDRVLDMIVDINARLGVAVLMVEQNAELALSIARRGYVLQTGRIVLERSAQSLLGDDLIREACPGKSTP